MRSSPGDSGTRPRAPRAPRFGCGLPPRSCATQPSSTRTCSGRTSCYPRRRLARDRGFALSVVLVCAIGIGATTAVFSVADHVLLRPLPFRDPDRLVKLWQDQSFRGYSRMELSPANYRDLVAGAHGFSGVAAFTPTSMNLTGGGVPNVSKARW